MEEVSPTAMTMSLAINYSPISIDKLRLQLLAEYAIRLRLRPLGFSKNDENVLKVFVSDNNIYLLCGTIFVGGLHVSNVSIAMKSAPF